MKVPLKWFNFCYFLSDAVLDLKIKSHMISDLFTLTGVHCQDPAVYSNRSRFVQKTTDSRQSSRSRPHSANLLTSTLGNTDLNTHTRSQFDTRPSTTKTRASSLARTKSEHSSFEGLSQNEASIFKSIQEEQNRHGGFIRLFPTSDTWEFFSQFLEVRTTSYNLMLHQKLFPKRWLHGTAKRTSISRAK
jgi:tubulin polyglutamylase TTLL5